MAKRVSNEYEPDSVSCPGETLLETIDALGMTEADLASRMGRPVEAVSDIVSGEAPITPETASALEKVLGVPAQFWNNRERHYREYLAGLAERRRGQSSWRGEGARTDAARAPRATRKPATPPVS